MESGGVIGPYNPVCRESDNAAKPGMSRRYDIADPAKILKELR
jgi:hypothetical protein